MVDQTRPSIDLTTLALYGWPGAYDRLLAKEAIVPAGYELRTLVRQVGAVWYDQHEAQAEEEIRAEFVRIHGAEPLRVEVVEEPCIDGHRIWQGQIQVLLTARAVRRADRWHAPAPEPAPAVDVEETPVEEVPRPVEEVPVEEVPRPVEEVPVEEPEPTPAPVPAPTAKRKPSKPRARAKAKAGPDPQQAPSWTPGELDHKDLRPPNAGLAVDLHYPTTPTADAGRPMVVRAVGALAANTQATDEDLRMIAHMLTDPISARYGTRAMA